ncbi:hypothetical protein [Glycomyces buryatensis]|uniref:Prevent-host-death family protein n=1 Tax=Glycomyces buryatensis TaxID=2570927 RepID=A0A4S8Q9Q5_9ACTN|nr:hypothetical protein [Glycomyces buryatensis]THV37074.1 hypothetical protein FAB82_21235 [Glycomyces buryatensis]
MPAPYEDLPFSDFLHHPAATAARLETVRSIVLRRRGSADLALSRADQADRDATVIDFTSRLLAGLARGGDTDAIYRVLPEALPWSTFLPDRDRAQMLSELIEVAQGSASLHNLAPIAVLLEQWRHSAEIHADPELYTRLTAEPEGDLGPISAPEEAA